MTILSLCLLTVSAFFCTWGMTDGLQWETQPDPDIVVCAGRRLTLPWRFRAADEEEIVNVQWVFNGVLSSELMATMAHEHFLATSGYSDRLRQVGNSGLSLSDVTVDDSGNYTVEVNVDSQGTFSSHRHSVSVHVGDGFMVEGGQLQVSQDPVALWDQSRKQWTVNLKCGTFISMREPAFHVLWTTPTEESKTSTGYDSGDFYLTLDSPVAGGNYSCTIPSQFLSDLCYTDPSGGPVTASVMVDEVRSRLSLLEADQKTLKEDHQRLKEQHRLDISNLTKYISETKQAYAEQMEALQTVQDLMREEFQALLNSTAVDPDEPVPAGQCAEGSYRVIDNKWRSPDRSHGGDDLCDSTLKPGWYRFRLSGANAAVPTECVPVNRCGTDAPVWIDLRGKDLPTAGKGVTGRACAHWASDCCNWEAPITVFNCGEFFIYDISPLSSCDLAFCAKHHN